MHSYNSSALLYIPTLRGWGEYMVLNHLLWTRFARLDQQQFDYSVESVKANLVARQMSHSLHTAAKTLQRCTNASHRVSLRTSVCDTSVIKGGRGNSKDARRGRSPPPPPQKNETLELWMEWWYLVHAISLTNSILEMHSTAGYFFFSLEVVIAIWRYPDMMLSSTTYGTRL